MFGEFTRGQLISAFREACSESADAGAAFIHQFIFQEGVSREETLNEEVDRKFAALSEFAADVLQTYGRGGIFQKLRPRDYMDELVGIDDPATKELRQKIYGAFYKAGHHIRELTDRPDYIIPKNAKALVA
ncbi:MAG: hypothetical protein AAGB32_05770 [Pseudomonadota bacterium]